MSLKRKYLAQNLLLALGLMLAAAGALWRLSALRREVAISVDIARAQGLFSDPRGNREPLVENLRHAIAGTNDFIAGDKEYANDPEAAAAYAMLTDAARRANRRLSNVLAASESLPAAAAAGSTPALPESISAELDNALYDV